MDLVAITIKIFKFYNILFIIKMRSKRMNRKMTHRKRKKRTKNKRTTYRRKKSKRRKSKRRKKSKSRKSKSRRRRKTNRKYRKRGKKNHRMLKRMDDKYVEDYRSIHDIFREGTYTLTGHPFIGKQMGDCALCTLDIMGALPPVKRDRAIILTSPLS